MKISGTGSVLPEKVVTNDMLSQFLDTSDEWIVSRTGVRTRHVISHERLDDMAVEASRKALDDAGLSPDQLGMKLGMLTGMLFPLVAVFLYYRLWKQKK